jgi:hypothetical protein
VASNTSKIVTLRRLFALLVIQGQVKSDAIRQNADLGQRNSAKREKSNRAAHEHP